MHPETIHVGIAYNMYIPLHERSQLRASEESVEEVAHEVLKIVRELDYRVTLLPLYISIEGFVQRLKKVKPDVIINLCEGFKGLPKFEANVAGIFETMGIRFTGNSSRTLALCQDKFKTKAVMNAFDLPTADSLLVTEPDQVIDFPFPLIVKPNAEDASLGIFPKSVFYEKDGLLDYVHKMLKTYAGPVLVESYISGREFNVAVLDIEKPVALPVSEIDFSTMPQDKPNICSYEAKWYKSHRLFKATVPVCPAHIEDSVREKLQSMSVGTFKAMECRDYVRVDFRMSHEGEIFILEVNPNPDVSRDAGYARGLAAANIDYVDFWNRLIVKSLNRKAA